MRAWTPEPTGSSRIVWPFLDYFRARGRDPAEIFAAHGLTEAQLRDPELRLSRSRLLAVWNSATEASGDPAIGLHLSEHIDERTYDVATYIGRSQQTLRESIEVFNRYARLWYEGNDYTLTRIGQRWIWRFDADSGRIGPVSLVEQLMAGLTAMAGQNLRPVVIANEAWFTHTEPAYVQEYERVFPSRLRFRAPCNGFVFDTSLDVPLPGADPTLAHVLERYTAELLAKLPKRNEVISRVREAISEQLRRGEPNLANVAARLGTSASTLRRHLIAEKTTFRHLSEELRSDLAQVYLSDRTMSIAEVAFLLRFTDAPAFYRAFKKWTGRTPTEFRQSHDRPSDR